MSSVFATLARLCALAFFRRCSVERGCSAKRPSISGATDRDVTAARSASCRAPCVHRAWRLHGRRRDLAKTYATSLRTRTRDRNGLRPRDTTIKRRRARRASPAGRVDGSFNSLRFEGGFGRTRWSFALLLPGLATGHGSITAPKIVAYDGDTTPKAAFINKC